jgi:serine/threonine protein kinase/tetratricopeptide (TPR) repeat protein
MTPHAHRSLEEIVRQARSLAPHEQASFIKEACASDQSLFESVTREVASASDDWADLDESAFQSEPIEADLIGALVGPYRVIRSLGEGGMGAVFLAERADGQFAQKVAIKLVRRGLLSTHVQKRLRIERQILATLDHPNIAKLLDGGTTSEGTPYIVMEYIDGEPIDMYCDRNALTVQDRLQLFKTVCSAVHAAHQNLIVHRDLKPSNILVTRAGVPKLLDFGIAKLLDERQAMQTLALTHADVRLMTPDHASPEQVRGDPITTASDVYVLAILLYELLTGLKPFARSTRLADLERAICEQTPPPPSSALTPSGTVPESQLYEIARWRGTTLPRLRRQLRGDLDRIVLMGLRKEPERRYPSVEQFSADVDRHLQGLPVRAQSDAWTYRTAKFVRRHFIVVGLAAAFIVSLIAFSITTYVQSIRIEQERDIAAQQRAVAEVQRGIAENAAAFMIQLFEVSDPSEARGNEIKAREILDQGARRIRTELKDQPELQATLMDTMGRVYMNLGLNRDAEPLAQEALQVRRQLFGERHESVASSITLLAEIRRNKGELAEALRLAEEALRIQRDINGPDSIQAAEALRNLGTVHYFNGAVDLAEPLLKQSLDIYVRHVGNEDARLTIVLDMLGRVAQARNNLDEAEDLLERAFEIERQASGYDHPLTIERLHNLATIMQSKNELDIAERQFREVIALSERVLGPSHPTYAAALSNLAYLLQSKGQSDDAKELYDRAVELNRRWRGEQHYTVGYDLSNIGILELDRGRLKEAERSLNEALRIYKGSLEPTHPYIAGALTMLGRVLLEQGRATDAEPVLEDALDIWSKEYGAESIEYAIALSALARSWALQGRADDAESAFKKSYPILRHSLGSDSESTRRVHDWIESFYARRNRRAEAKAYFETFSPRDN